MNRKPLVLAPGNTCKKTSLTFPPTGEKIDRVRATVSRPRFGTRESGGNIRASRFYTLTFETGFPSLRVNLLTNEITKTGVFEASLAKSHDAPPMR